MRIIEERTFKVTVIAPEDDKENQELRRIIEEVEQEDKKFDPSEWKRDLDSYDK